MRKTALILVLLGGLLGFSQPSAEVLVPYRDGKNWGLSNLKGEIKLKPQYAHLDCKESYALNYFAFADSTKAGLLKGTKQIIAPSNYEGFQFYEDAVIVAKYGRKLTPQEQSVAGKSILRREELYTMDGVNVFPEHFLDLSRVASFGKSKKGKDIPRLMLLKCKRFNNLYSLFEFDVDAGKITRWLLEDYFYIEQRRDQQLNLRKVKDDQADTKYYVYREGQVKIVPVAMDNDRDADADSPSADTYMSMDMALTEDKSEVYKYRLYKNKVFLKTTKAGVKTEVPLTLPKADEFKIASFEKPVAQYDNLGDFRYDNFVTFKKDGKVGFLSHDKMIPAQFESLELVVFGPYEKRTPGFIVSVKDPAGNLKYGTVNHKGEVLVPAVYDELRWNERPQNRPSTFTADLEFIVRKENRYGMIDNRNKTILEPKYDSIHYNGTYSDSFFVLEKAGKYGLLYKEPVTHKITIAEPLFDMPPSGVRRNFQGTGITLLTFLTDATFLGYANPDGTRYFKN